MSIVAPFAGICARSAWKYPETSLICASAASVCVRCALFLLLCLCIRLASLLLLFSLPLYNETSKFTLTHSVIWIWAQARRFAFCSPQMLIALGVKAAMGRAHHGKLNETQKTKAAVTYKSKSDKSIWAPLRCALKRLRMDKNFNAGKAVDFGDYGGYGCFFCSR